MEFASRYIHRFIVRFDGPLSLLDVDAYADDTTLDIETRWEVTAPTDGPPFSVMAHLVQGDGVALQVADGLRVTAADLRSGDIVIQRHSFQAEDATADLWFRTGVYWAAGTELWDVSDRVGNAVFVRVGEALER